MSAKSSPDPEPRAPGGQVRKLRRHQGSTLDHDAAAPRIGVEGHVGGSEHRGRQQQAHGGGPSARGSEQWERRWRRGASERTEQGGEEEHDRSEPTQHL